MTHTTIHELRWDERQRLTLLEARAIWAGRVAPDDLRQTFGVTAAQADKDFALYQQLCPYNLQFDLADGTYRATDRFEPALLRGTAQEFLHVLRNHAVAPDQPLAIVAAHMAPVEVLEPPEREFDVRILQRVTTAIRERRALRVEYQSLTHPEPRPLELAPHALVYTGRWHARAWSREHAEYRDFLLSRMRGIPELLGPGAQRAEQDWDWRNFVNVKIGAHPDLSDSQKRVIEADYGMQNGIHERAVRVALLPYYLRLLNVGGDDRGRPPAEQQIVLLNRAELEAYARFA
ncbi:MAG: WYL domain-containing protein [Gammaproteobacteria bacterium]|nr:WYL domain-containing protein [Gammaproteobacteria bacterium]